jgi:DNA-binding NtrC family response regulator
MPVKKSCQSILAGEGTGAATPAHQAGFARFSGNKLRTAQVLGLNRQGMIKKLKRYGITSS